MSQAATTRQAGTFLPGPQYGKFVRDRQFAIAVMKDVCDGKVVVESRINQGDGGKRYCAEYGDSRAARRFAQAVRVLIRKGKCNQACDETVCAERQCKQKRKAAQEGKIANLWHGLPRHIFSERVGRSNQTDVLAGEFPRLRTQSG